ncbi:hypothetical protein T02_4691 [Trichinella nativa]|uniref:Uncharacterized protein n=1 Tax=Trichinella nativa TaxID=6335 RepID=A0A0V1LH53_9BILA|nr:hypothetical protein T02_4691 [Trichinella nativa]
MLVACLCKITFIDKREVPFQANGMDAFNVGNFCYFLTDATLAKDPKADANEPNVDARAELIADIVSSPNFFALRLYNRRNEIQNHANLYSIYYMHTAAIDNQYLCVRNLINGFLTFLTINYKINTAYLLVSFYHSHLPD